MITKAFRPRARLLQLLGEELMGNPRLAVFELVKNAYDADASKVTVTIEHPTGEESKISIVDDGEGMDLDTLTRVWLEPGTDHRKAQRQQNRRTKKFGRLPLGEKGVGRFAAHKLGQQITLVTRRLRKPEYVIQIDWDVLSDTSYLDEVLINIQERKPEEFTGRRSGTRIEITRLKVNWSRREIRSLQRDINSIRSPFHRVDSFEPILLMPGHEPWLEDVIDIDDILSRAMWLFAFQISKRGEFTWKYEFKPLTGIKLAGRKLSGKRTPLIIPEPGSFIIRGRTKSNLVADEGILSDVGPVKGQFYVYDREKEVMQMMVEKRGFDQYLDENGGIRVYRDGIRVYNYGEPEDDWLSLDIRRVNIPARRISNNLILGAIDLSLKESTGLIEKTNREGFVEGSALTNLKRLGIGAINVLETYRYPDKLRVKQLFGRGKKSEVAKFSSVVDKLVRELKRRKIWDVLEPQVRQIQRHVKAIYEEFESREEALVRSAISGQNLSLVFHEIERGIRTLHQAIQAETPIDQLREQSERLTDLLGGFSEMIRRDPNRRHDLKKVVTEALTLNNPRFDYHQIVVSSPLCDGTQKSVKIRASFGLLLGGLTNIIDNAIYWLRVRWPDDNVKARSGNRRLYFGISHDFETGPALIIADNGTGLKDPPAELVRPFFTRKPDGMGLGLYYVSFVMSLLGGELVFPNHADVDVPKSYDGAVIALVFKD